MFGLPEIQVNVSILGSNTYLIGEVILNLGPFALQEGVVRREFVSRIAATASETTLWAK